MKDHPEWLYDFHDAEDLARVLEMRPEGRSMSYGQIMSWEEAAILLEDIFPTVLLRDFLRDLSVLSGERTFRGRRWGPLGRSMISSPSLA